MRKGRLQARKILLALGLVLVFGALSPGASPARADVCVDPWYCWGSAVVDKKICNDPDYSETTKTYTCGTPQFAYQKTVSCNPNCEYQICSSNDTGAYCELVLIGAEAYCVPYGCTTTGNCCAAPGSGPTPTPGGGGGAPQPYVKPIFRVLLDTNDDDVGDQLIYTSANPACSGSNSLANPFSVTLTRPDSLCSGATTMWTKDFHETCFLGPGIFYIFANSPCSQDIATNWSIGKQAIYQETSRSPWTVGSNLVL